MENLTNYNIDINGTVVNKKTGRILKTYLHHGYPTITLKQSNGKKRNYFIHRLVAEIYIPNIDNKPFVNHIDGNTKNFSKENLEWCTQKENIYHSKKLTGHGAVISKKKLLELYKNNSSLNKEEFLDLILNNCN